VWQTHLHGFIFILPFIPLKITVAFVAVMPTSMTLAFLAPLPIILIIPEGVKFVEVINDAVIAPDPRATQPRGFMSASGARWTHADILKIVNIWSVFFCHFSLNLSFSFAIYRLSIW
jgi:hypothetical protein